jgi:pectate lyase
MGDDCFCPGRALRRQRRGALWIVAGACGLTASGALGCTLSADEFSPTPLGSEGDLAAAEAAELEGGSDAVEGGSAPVSAPAEGEMDEARPSALPLAEAEVASGASGSPDPAAAAAGDDELSLAGASPDAGVAPPAALVLPELSPLEGWAGLPGLGVSTTTGGGDAPARLARTAAELVALAARPEPLTIAIEGTIEVPALLLTSNKTFVGLDREATLAGGIAVRGTPDAFVTNVIIANLNIAAETSEVDGDGIQLHYAHHIWVDHCALRDAADGLLDIVHGSDFVTVSHTRFSYTRAAPEPAHRFAALVGDDLTNGAEDRGHLNVTWHHDFWGEGVSRAVAGRFGSLHVYNSLFRSPGGSAVLLAGLDSRWLVENNRFEDVAEPHTILLGSGASLAATGNVYVAATGARDATATGFSPAYPYAIDSPLELVASISAQAGPR